VFCVQRRLQLLLRATGRIIAAGKLCVTSGTESAKILSTGKFGANLCCASPLPDRETAAAVLSREDSIFGVA